ncbi:hypothetical protein INR49_027158, partial [Caranx melampygus]
MEEMERKETLFNNTTTTATPVTSPLNHKPGFPGYYALIPLVLLILIGCVVALVIYLRRKARLDELRHRLIPLYSYDPAEQQDWSDREDDPEEMHIPHNGSLGNFALLVPALTLDSLLCYYCPLQHKGKPCTNITSQCLPISAAPALEVTMAPSTSCLLRAAWMLSSVAQQKSSLIGELNMLQLLHVSVLWFYLLLPSLLCDNLPCYYSPILEKGKTVELIVTECPPSEVCYMADGHYGNHSALSTRGCMPQTDCSQVHKIRIKGTVYIMSYTCCDKPYCNSCLAITANLLSIT